MDAVVAETTRSNNSTNWINSEDAPVGQPPKHQPSPVDPLAVFYAIWPQQFKNPRKLGFVSRPGSGLFFRDDKVPPGRGWILTTECTGALPISPNDQRSRRQRARFFLSTYLKWSAS
jgi:hypothetical protein